MEAKADVAPSAAELQERWARIHTPATEQPGTSAKTDPGEPLRARCTKCSEWFSYTPVRAGDVVIVRRSVCESCASDEASEEAQLAALEGDTEGRRLKLLERITGNAAECRDMTFETFDAQYCGSKPIEAAQQFVREVLEAGEYDGVRGLYLWGEYGTGKTHLVVAVIDALIRGGRGADRVLFDRADELILHIQDTYTIRTSTLTVTDVRKQAGVWILDDLGTEQPTADAGRHLRGILSRRVLKPTLITSNVPPDRLEQQNPELGRVVSRLGGRYFRTIEVRGPDQRSGGRP